MEQLAEVAFHFGAWASSSVVGRFLVRVEFPIALSILNFVEKMIFVNGKLGRDFDHPTKATNQNYFD